MKKPQKQLILEHLQKGHSLTKLQVFNEKFDWCMSFPQRIFDLREDGEPVIKRMIKTTSGKWVAQYRLIKVGSEVEYENELYRVKEIHNSEYFFHYKTKALSKGFYSDNFIIRIQKKKYARIKTVDIKDLS